MVRYLSVLLCLSGSIGVKAETATKAECTAANKDELTCEKVDGCVWFKGKDSYECVTAEEHGKRVEVNPDCTSCEAARQEFKKQQKKTLSKGLYSIVGCGPLQYSSLNPPTQKQLEECMQTKLPETIPGKGCKKEMQYCHAEFIDIFEAYYTALDPAATKKFEENQEFKDFTIESELLEEMWRVWHSKAPDGEVRINYEDGIRKLEEIPFIGSRANLYADESSVFELDAQMLMGQVQSGKENWLVQLYRSTQEESIKAKPEYEKVAAALEDIASLGAVNCDAKKEKPFCKQVVPKGETYPFFIWSRTIKDMQGGATEAQVFYTMSTAVKGLSLRLQQFVASQLPDFTTELTDKKQMREWLDKDDLPKAVLLTDAASAPPYWIKTSSLAKDRMSLGIVYNCTKKGDTKTELQKEFAVKRIPAIIHIDRSGEVGAIVDTHKAPFTMPHIRKFIKKHALAFDPKKAEPEKRPNEEATEEAQDTEKDADTIEL